MAINDENTLVIEGQVREQVRERYGRIAEQSSPDQQASCCGPSDAGSACCGPETAVNIDQIKMMYEAPDATDLPAEVTTLYIFWIMFH